MLVANIIFVFYVQEQNAAQHWAMQPPPGFAAPTSTGQLSNPQSSTTAQPHTKLISAGSDSESKSIRPNAY